VAKDVVEVEVVRKRGVSLSKAAHLIQMAGQRDHARITLEERLHLIQVLPPPCISSVAGFL